MRRFAPRLLVIACVAFAAYRLTMPIAASGPTVPALTSATFFGGAGDQSGTAVAISGGEIYVAGTNTSFSSSLAGKYSLPPAAPAWLNSLGSNTLFSGAAPDPSGGVYAVGSCLPPACGASDGSGGTEFKGGIAHYGPAGNLISARSLNFFAYRGTEMLNAATSTVEGGATFVYATGGGEPCSFFLFAAAKFDASGNVVAKATEPGMEPDFTSPCAVPPSSTSATGDSIVSVGSSIYIAGASASRPADYTGYAGDGDATLRPALLRYDQNLNRVWKRRPTDVAGQLFGIAESGGSLYAVGYANNGTQDYLVQKYDLNGNRLWSRISGGAGADVLNGIVVMGGRLFAVGSTSSSGSGGTDGVMLEIDVTTGDTLSTTLYGGAQNDKFNGVTTDGTDLYVIGETKSFANGANPVGQNEGVLLRYGLGSAGATTTTVTGSPNPSLFGQQVSFAASVQSGGAAVTTGSVTIKEGTLTLAGPINVDGTGHVSFDTTTLGVGPHTITAQYNGSAGFSTSSSNTAQTVNAAATSTVLTSSVNGPIFGQSVSFTAVVSPVAPSSGTPTGNVSFQDGASTIGSASLVGGSATFSTSALSAGPHNIVAVYNGDSGFLNSQGTRGLSVNAAGTSISMFSSNSPSLPGQNVTLTAMVNPIAPGAGVPTGNVTFSDGMTALGTVALDFGKANLTTSLLSVGMHGIQATYQGDGNFHNSSGSFTQTVRDVTPPVLSLPSNITVEATGQNGATVNYVATAMDDIDGSRPVNCSQNSGGTFSIGTTPVNCSATDLSGNSAFGNFNVTVQDTTAPSLSLPMNIGPLEATFSTGRQVGFTPTASDIVDGNRFVSCSPSSNSTFHIGTTTVNCTVSDNRGNSASGSFTVAVQDTTAPSLSLPMSVGPLEAASAAGKQAFFSVNSFDTVDGSRTVLCNPASNSTFPLGTTTVNCSASDTHSNTRTGSFPVTVRDTTAPTIQQLSSLHVSAVSATGTTVTFNLPTATDQVDPHPVVTTSPASGSLFSNGATQVTVTAKDFSNNTRTSSFTVKVEPALVSIDTRTDQGASSASLNLNQTQQFIAIGHFTDGSTQSTADNGSGSGSGSGSGDPSTGGGGSTQSSHTLWSVNFSPMLNANPCSATPIDGSYSTQVIDVDSTGHVDTTWSPVGALVHVVGQVTLAQVSLTFTCVSGLGAPASFVANWQNTFYSGAVTFNGVTSNLTVTGWSSQPAMPTARFALGGASVNGKVYAVGGGTGGVGGGGPVSLVEVYDTSTKLWSALTPTGTSMVPRDGPGVAALNGSMYVVGGHTSGGNAIGTLQRYDPGTNVWTTLASMPTARAELAFVEAGGMLYAIGGEPGNGTTSPLTTVERYNPAADMWDTRASMTIPRAMLPAAALNNGATIITVGGFSNGSVSTSTELYDVATNTWSAGTPAPSGISTGGGATINNIFYAVAASACGAGGPGTMYGYSPALAGINGHPDGWTFMPNLPTSRGSMAVTASGTDLYTLGGLNATNTSVNLNEVFSTFPPGNGFYSQGPFDPQGGGCGSGGGGNDGGGGGDNGPTWRIVDPATGMDSTIASVDATGLATALAPGTALVVAETEGISCVDTMNCATLTVERSAPAFSALASHSIEYGTPSVTLTGHIEAPGPRFPPAGETISILVNGSTTSALLDARGDFSAAVDAHSLTVASHPVTYSYSGDTILAAAGDTHTALTVVDTTPPVLTLPLDLTKAATGPGGAVVDFYVAAFDVFDKDTLVDCSPHGGGVFPLGVTLVNCFSTDSHGNTGRGTFTVTVRDATPPVLSLPATVTTDAIGSAGALVSFTATALDAIDGSRPVTCTPASGAMFAIGTTTVSCSSSDTHGNTATGTFTVQVRSAVEMAQNLIGISAADGMQQSSNLLSKVLQYATNAASVNRNAACNDLGAFTNQAQAQSGKKITVAQASALLTLAQHLSATLGCP